MAIFKKTEDRDAISVDRIITWNERRANQLTFRRNRNMLRETEIKEDTTTTGEGKERKERESLNASNGRCKREAFTFNGFAPEPSRSSGLKILGSNEVS